MSIPFLDDPAEPAGDQPSASAPAAPEQPGDRIGPYKLIEQIGVGGFGVVFKAEQDPPLSRIVALKVIKLGMDTRRVIERFDRERQALAMMEHPGIARVLDAGATASGRPYFVMEHVVGVSITRYCDTHQLSLRQRVDLFVQVCHAIQHAHQKGVVHCDLKPSNILVSDADGHAIPKVIDFGIARATSNQGSAEKTALGVIQPFLGTPAYMSPEQAAGRQDIDTRSDIYSLGMLLYELLAARPAFDLETLEEAALGEILRVVREVDPPRPSARLTTLTADNLTTAARCRQAEPARLPALLRGDLDWIVMRCLEKDRARRYESVGGLASDLLRHLAHKPVFAGPPSRLYVVKKLVRRHRLAFAAAAAVLGALILGVGLSTWMYLREKEARTGALAAEAHARTEARNSAQMAAFLEEMLEGVGPAAALGRDTGLLREILDKTRDRLKTGLETEPEVQARLWNTLGGVYAELGEYAQAENAYRAGIALRSAQPGGEDTRLAVLFTNLGNLLDRRGRYAEAEALHRRALALQERLLGAEHAEIAKTLSHLGIALVQQGKFTEAETDSRRSLAILRQVDGAEGLSVAYELGNLGGLLGRINRLRESEAAFREALRILRKRLNPQHPLIATTLSNLGITLASLGDAPGAAGFFQEALVLKRKILPPEHPGLSFTLDSLGESLQRQGKHHEAELAHQEALGIRRKRLGNEHRDVAISLSNLAQALQAQGKLAEAETALREALSIRHKLHPEADEEVAATAVRLASLLAARHQTAAAVDAWRDGLACRRSLLSRKTTPGAEDFAPLVEALCDLAAALEDVNSFAEAEALGREAVELARLHLPTDWRAWAARVLVGEALAGQSKFAEAEPLLREGYDGLMARPQETPATRLRLSDATECLVRLYESTGRTNLAAEWRNRTARGR